MINLQLLIKYCFHMFMYNLGKCLTVYRKHLIYELLYIEGHLINTEKLLVYQVLVIEIFLLIY